VPAKRKKVDGDEGEEVVVVEVVVEDQFETFPFNTNASLEENFWMSSLFNYAEKIEHLLYIKIMFLNRYRLLVGQKGRK
jgi:hypothetical protein